jgi:hypothetical protein
VRGGTVRSAVNAIGERLGKEDVVIDDHDDRRRMKMKPIGSPINTVARIPFLRKIGCSESGFD